MRETMSGERIQVLNYSAHALDDLRQMQKSLASAAPRSSKVLGDVIRLLDESVKFILPNCCSLIEPDELRQTHVDMARLPFPCVAYETPWSTGEFVEHTIGGQPQIEVTKRIALCWEAGSVQSPIEGLDDYLVAYPEGGVFVYPIYWGPEFESWLAGFGGMFCPYEDTLKSASQATAEPIASQLANMDILDAGLADANAKRLTGEPFHLLPEFYHQLVQTRGSREEANAQIMNDARDECFIHLQASCILGCSNIEVGEIEPSAKSNAKRKARGNQPFFSYKVLEITEERKARTAEQGGSSASPRMHLRRGHLRRLKDRTIWVRPAMVNVDSKRGIVDKDYAIKKKR